jgi:nucleoside-diphosphate-sugar epimerase
MSATVLMTGASGFIGKHCLDYLRTYDVKIYCLSREKIKSRHDNVEWIVCDILNAYQLEQVMIDMSPDYLIHLAWYVEHQKFWQSKLNADYVLATSQLWKHFIKNKGKKAVFLGSCAEESSTLYGRSKKITSNMISLIGESSDNCPSYVWGRIFGLYGPGENPLRIVPYLLQTYILGKTPEIKNPHSEYDFIYVKNLAKMIVGSLFNDICGVVDFGQGTQFTIEHLANQLQQKFFPQMNKPNTLPSDDFVKFIPDLHWQKHINFNFELTSFEDSIVEYLSYLKEFGTRHEPML